MLQMCGRRKKLTEDGLSTIAHSIAYSSQFDKLAIPYDFGSTTAYCLNQEVNEARKRNGLSPIEIKGEYMLYGFVMPIICSILHGLLLYAQEIAQLIHTVDDSF
jgi:hypothetical protein